MNEKEIRRLINTSYSRRVRKPFMKAVREFQLVGNGDRIAVCVSGGKDSMLLALLMKELQNFLDFENVFLSMDPGFTGAVRRKLEENAALLGLGLEIFETDVLRIAAKHSARHPCFLCSKMRRGYLYSEASKRGCNKIALGHHYDDTAVTALMGMLYGGQLQYLRPKVKAANYQGMELIRPLCNVRENSINSFWNECGIDTGSCGCNIEKPGSYREKVKSIIETLSEDNPQVKANIINAVKKSKA